MRTDALARVAGDFILWGLAGRAGALGLIARLPAASLLAAGLFYQPRPDRFDLVFGQGCIQAGLDAMAETLVAAGHARALRGEAMPLRLDWDGDVLGHVDHAVMRCLGILTDKVHLNGLLRDASGSVRAVWLGRRSRAMRTAPGHWDNLAAGGVSLGADIATTLAAEAAEEAGISADWLDDAVPIGMMQLDYATAEGLSRERLHIFDIDLPADFQPVCHDGEIEEFRAMDAAALRALLDGAEPVKHAPHAVLSAGLARWFGS